MSMNLRAQGIKGIKSIDGLYAIRCLYSEANGTAGVKKNKGLYKAESIYIGPLFKKNDIPSSSKRRIICVYYSGL